jgi:hypothetical protein
VKAKDWYKIAKAFYKAFLMSLSFALLITAADWIFSMVLSLQPLLNVVQGSS